MVYEHSEEKAERVYRDFGYIYRVASIVVTTLLRFLLRKDPKTSPAHRITYTAMARSLQEG